MNGRFVAAMALIVAAAGFSGCLEAIASLSSQDTEVTAMQHRRLADDAAAAWNPDAELRAVFALENPNLTDEFPADPSVGNGRAPAWLYGYTTENGTAYRAFQVSADGQVRVLDESASAPDVGGTLDAWAIDSDAAVAVARANSTFESVAAQEGAVVMEALGAEEGALVWAIMAGTASQQAIAVVDAVEGTLIMAETFDMDFDLPPMPFWNDASWAGPQVELSDSGTLDGDYSQEGYDFSIARADVGTLELSIEKRLPMDGIYWAIVDAHGEIVADGSMGWFNYPRETGSFEFTLDEPGDYTLVLTYESMSVVDMLGSVDYDMYLLIGPMGEIDVDVDCC